MFSTILFWVYWAFALLCLVLTGWGMYKEQGIREKVSYALVLIPLLLRTFLIK